MKETLNYHREYLEQQNKNVLCNMILDMQSASQQKDEIIAANERDLRLLKEEVRLLRDKEFGRKSERAKERAKERYAQAKAAGQVSLDELDPGVFNEAETLSDAVSDTASDAAEKTEPETITIKEHTRKKRSKGKQKEDLSHLRKEIEHFQLPEAQLQELFPDGYRELPEDITSQIECIPAEYYVKESHIHVYCDKADNSHIVRADAPKKLFGKGLASPSLVAGVMNAKYTNALPLYRIEQEMERNEVPVSRQTMANWIIMAGERYLSLLAERLKAELIGHHVIHADETPMLVTKDGRKAGSKSYMWVYRSSVLDAHPVVLFDYQKTRHYDHPKEFLKDFSGVLVTDGYESYHKLAKERHGEITVAGCWIHTNRKFKDALKGLGKAGKGTKSESIAGEAVQRIGKIFDEDNRLNTLSSEERLRIRRETIAPMVDDFFQWIKAHRSDVAMKSLTGKAITYTLNQENYLREFLKDGDVPMENNAAERAIRPFCIGKKNWVMSDTVQGAQVSGMIYGIVETAKANQLKPYEYLKYLLEEIPKHADDTSLDFLDALLPWAESLPEECRKKC